MATEGLTYFEVEPTYFSVVSWRSTPDAVKPTEVHLAVEVANTKIQRIVVRFKGPNSLDKIIDVLKSRREEVWGKRDDDV